MKIGELFETAIADKIEPVIKVNDRDDEQKLAGEIGSYVVTPIIEKYLAGFLDHYTDTFLLDTGEIGAWISGYFGSGKSHLAKIIGLLAENRRLLGSTACERFETRLSKSADSDHVKTIKRALARVPQCDTRLLAFNVNTLADSKATPLPKLLLSQFYQAKGYGSNLLYARVIETELDRRGKLADLHAAVEQATGRFWADIQKNPTFYQRHLYDAASKLAPDEFPTPQHVNDALQKAHVGELHNVGFLVDALVSDLEVRERELGRRQRLMLVLDESGQWIEGDKDRLAQLQALIEEAAGRGRGRIWVVVTTHGDMGSVLREAKALEGDMKKIEARFRYKFSLTTENIELVLEDRLFKKKFHLQDELFRLYDRRSGVLRDMGQLREAGRELMPCTRERFTTYYPFVPYQVGLIPDIVKSLRSRGGRGEQLSGSTRTLLAITQDILRAGRRSYLDEQVGLLVSFDEVYGNLAGEGEVSPDIRDELNRISAVVPEATELTQHVAEVLYLVRELNYVVRSKENLARLLARDVEDDVAALIQRIEPELERLQRARMVGQVGDEYEFLTGERRTFEDEVASREAELRIQDKERGLALQFFHEPGRAWWTEWVSFQSVAYQGAEFDFKLLLDGFNVPGRKGHVTVRITTPLGRETLESLEDRSLRADEQSTIFLLASPVPRFEEHLARYLAMKEVIETWRGDTHRSEEAKGLAQERARDDLPKARKRVIDDLKQGLSRARLVFRGSSRQVTVPNLRSLGETLRGEVAACWPAIYPKFERLPIRVSNEETAIRDVLSGGTSHRTAVALGLFDKAGKLEPAAVVLDAIRVQLAAAQARSRRVLGADLLGDLSAPPYGWDPNAVRVGVAALVRAGLVKLVVKKKTLTNPSDPELVDAIRVARTFDKVELVLEETEIDPDELASVRSLLRRITKRRDLDETPAALAEAAGLVAQDVAAQAERIRMWAEAASLPLSAAFQEGVEAWGKVAMLTQPVHRVREVLIAAEPLALGHAAVAAMTSFQAEHGAAFVSMTRLAATLAALEHRLDRPSPCRSFLAAMDHARQGRTIADRETWQQLRYLENNAGLEVNQLCDRWRAAARELLEAAFADGRDQAATLQLPSERVEAALQPLVELLGELDATTELVRVASLPEIARQAADRARRALLEEAARRPPPGNEPGGDGGAPPPSRPRRAIRVRELIDGIVIRDAATWALVRGQLDREIEGLLADFDVELI